uniref:Visinin-like protein 1 n=1 Tax=Phallusia mammillata TaxID=59560 RepID=A0A6F9DW27_9ASCI|nr:visinin-like protein 1 [Phallusia mammillata]
MTLKRFLGASLSKNVSVTPPVKSSMASVVLPPFSAS